MKILCNNTKIHKIIKDSQWTDWAYFNTRIDGESKYWILKPDGSDNVHLPLTLLDLKEDEINRDLCRNILYVRNKADKDGNQKYYIENGNIKERPNWKEYIEDSH